MSCKEYVCNGERIYKYKEGILASALFFDVLVSVSFYLILTVIFFKSASLLELPTINSYFPGTTRMVLLRESHNSKLLFGTSIDNVVCSPAFK